MRLRKTRSRGGIAPACACRKIRTAESLTKARERVTRLRPIPFPGKPVFQRSLLRETLTGAGPIDEAQAFQNQCPTGIVWTIQPGDTFFQIARATGTTVERIAALNPGVDPERLEVGMQICLPEEAALPRGPIPPCASGLYWVVAQGDTLFSIARTYGTTVERLLELNPGIDPSNLQIGMSICLPG
ncbi:MAG: LysM peptidoglycan-binding domain-containing protein [Bacillota bacterium]|nr:LysM peptidoglycan-binding domain-containing protein [Candidatus Fermentithermobacillaceae bacterium]